MHQGAVQSSPAQQMVAAAGPSWWSINGIIPPLPQYSATPPLYHNFPYRQLSPSSLVAPPSSSWNDDQETIHQFSCSQLILGGFVGAEDNPPGLRTLENWEQQLLNLTSNSGSSSDYSAGGHGNNADQFQPTAGSWSNLMASAASSPSSCLTTLSNNLVDFSPKSSDLKHLHHDPSPECNSIGTTTTGGAAKKARIQPPSAQSTFKVRKEKLGDRITALHQLVSPFGKTDTASVLLEAIGYIRFLQSQIEALSLPYLGCSMKSGSTRQPLPAESKEDEKNKLRNRGLCLVPISCTVQMESNNGADYWAPGFGANFR